MNTRKMQCGRFLGGLVAMMSLLAISSVQAATVFSSVDGNINFLFGDLQGGVLALFDDSDQSYTGPSLNVPVPSVVGITGPVNAGGDYLATNSLGDTPLTLTGSNQFILGLFVGGQWLADSDVVPQGANSYSVFFSNGGSVLEVDVQIIPTAVPVPAAVWLFCSGLLGLAGVSRHRAA